MCTIVLIIYYCTQYQQFKSNELKMYGQIPFLFYTLYLMANTLCILIVTLYSQIKNASIILHDITKIVILLN